MRITALITGFVLALMLTPTVQAKGRAAPIVLDVERGETAFALDLDEKKAWWLKGECRVALPISRSESTATRLLSEPQTEDVTLGNRKIKMTQQFRFDVEDDLATVSIYSSVRSGWAAVPVKRDRACEASACRARTELPEC